jgi:long-chain fatty acid transport protein
MRMIGFGPVQNSMGGASVGAPLDTSTAITNPAGLGAIDKRADLSGTYFNPTVKMQANQAGSGKEITSDRDASYMPTLGLSWGGLAENLSLGFAAGGASGMGVDYKADLMNRMGQQTRAVTSYSNMRVAPAVSYQVMQGLSLGVAVNLMWAQMKWEAMGLQPRTAQNSFGYGATVGVLYTPVELVSVGFAYETVSTFQNFEWNIPSQDFGGGMVLPANKEKLQFDQPQMATLGLGVRPVQGLLVAADVEWIDWSGTNGYEQPKYKTDPNATAAPEFNLHWSDQVVLKLGAQYDATKELKVRVGYNYGKSPLDKARAFENLVFPAIAEHHITAGAGYDFGKLSVNVAGVYVPEAKLTATTQDMGTYTTKMSQLQIDLGVSYRM